MKGHVRQNHFLHQTFSGSTTLFVGTNFSIRDVEDVILENVKTIVSVKTLESLNRKITFSYFQSHEGLRMRRIFLVILIGMCAFICEATESPPSLDTFTKEEQSLLNKVFDIYISRGMLGYVFYGNKPMYWNGFRNIEDYDSNLQQDEELIVLDKALPALQKLVHDGKNYRISYQYSKGEHLNKTFYAHDFTFINKKALKKVIRKNLAVFREKAGKKLSTNQIYEGVLNHDLPFIEGSHSLFGILLGYGAENSLIWERGVELDDEIDKEMGTAYLAEMDNFQDIQKEYESRLFTYTQKNPDKWGDYLQKIEKFGNEPVPGINLNFAYFPHTKESKAIIKDYQKAEKKMKKALRSQDYLTLILKELN